MENGGLFGRKAMKNSVGRSQESYIFVILNACPGKTEQTKINSQVHTSEHKHYRGLDKSLLSLTLPLLGDNNFYY